MALKEAHGGAAWTDVAEPLRDAQPAALERRRAASMRTRAGGTSSRSGSSSRSGVRCAMPRRLAAIRIMGDMPIFVAHDSADVWAHRDQFHLRADGAPRVVAGVPPDYFSATGQLWGNPLYRWDRMKADGYAWWIERLRTTLALVDPVRLDHFRGFEAYWEVPGERRPPRTALAAGPAASSSTRCGALGPLPIVAEDLGVITPEVEALRDALRAARHGDPAVRLRRAIRRRTTSCRTTTRATASSTRARTTTTRSSAGRAAVPATARDRRGCGARAARLPRPTSERRATTYWDFIRARARLGGRHRDRAAAGRARPGQRGAHERAGPRRGQLALAPAARRAHGVARDRLRRLADLRPPARPARQTFAAPPAHRSGADRA